MKKILAALLSLILTASFSFLHAQSDINLSAYTLTFDDEFNSLSATTANPKGPSTWFAGPANGPAGNFSASTWNINSFSVSNGILSDQAWYSPTPIGQYNWQSGMLSSVDPSTTGFTQQYGYFEIRCQMPNAGEGAWPAFELDTTSGISHQQNEEIDVFEWYGVTNTPGNQQGFIQQASHNWNADGSHAAGNLYAPQTKLPDGSYPWQGYHTYGCQIDPVHLTWYIDGVQTNQVATPTSYLNSPFYMMVDYALGGGWPLSGSPFTTEGSSSLQVDWVRVYALPPPNAYNDSFTRTGALTGSKPDVADTNGNTWAETYFGSLGGSSVAPNGAGLPSASHNIDGGVLPVNGASGVTLDGTKDFTLSANFVTGTSYNSVALSLGASLNSLAALKLNSGTSTSADAYGKGSVVGFGKNNYNGTQTNTLTMGYSAATGLITFEVNGSPINVYKGGNTLAVTPAQIQALTYVGFEFLYSGANNASMNNFILTVK